MRELIDFIFSVNGEKIEGYGEDACTIEVDENKALLGVFDGCGGVGSRKYAEHNNMTGAYIASRKVRDGQDLPSVIMMTGAERNFVNTVLLLSRMKTTLASLSMASAMPPCFS